MVDEFDKIFDSPEMKKDFNSIFMNSNRQKQVMMFSVTMSDRMKKG